jgi:hypothetical protein
MVGQCLQRHSVRNLSLSGISAVRYARVPNGSVVVKVSAQAKQRPGLIFVPIHWSDATAADARVGEAVAGATDPFSGQPESKATPAKIERVVWLSFSSGKANNELTASHCSVPRGGPTKMTYSSRPGENPATQAALRAGSDSRGRVPDVASKTSTRAPAQATI